MLTVVALLMGGGISMLAWFNEHASRLSWGVLFALVLGGCLWLISRSFRSASPREPRASDETADVVGVRIALDAGVAPSLVAGLQRALTLRERERLPAIAALLLDAREQWRFTALDATRPLPAPKAARLFDSWADDVRKRFAPRGGLAAGAPFQARSLLVICLHLETSEEIPDASITSPDAVWRTLLHLRDAPLSVRQVDLWSSSEPVSARDLAERDRTMVAIA